MEEKIQSNFLFFTKYTVQSDLVRVDTQFLRLKGDLQSVLGMIVSHCFARCADVYIKCTLV